MTASLPTATSPPVATVKVPQTTAWVQLDLGKVSILFSFGRPVGVDTGKDAGVFVLAANKATTKHLNRWRDFRVQIELPLREFNLAVLGALHSAAIDTYNLEMNK